MRKEFLTCGNVARFAQVAALGTAAAGLHWHSNTGANIARILELKMYVWFEMLLDGVIGDLKETDFEK